MEDRRNNKAQRPHTRWNPKKHISLMSLLLGCKMAAVWCFVWHLGLQMWSGSEAARRNLEFFWFLKNSISSHLKMFLVLNAIFDVVLFRKGGYKMSLGWFFEAAVLVAGATISTYCTIWYKPTWAQYAYFFQNKIFIPDVRLAVGAHLVYWNCFLKSACVCMYLQGCLYLCMYVCLPAPTWANFRSQKQPVYEKWRLYRACIKLIGELWFKRAGLKCRWNEFVRT